MVWNAIEVLKDRRRYKRIKWHFVNKFVFHTLLQLENGLTLLKQYVLHWCMSTPLWRHRSSVNAGVKSEEKKSRLKKLSFVLPICMLKVSPLVSPQAGFLVSPQAFPNFSNYLPLTSAGGPSAGADGKLWTLFWVYIYTVAHFCPGLFPAVFWPLCSDCIPLLLSVVLSG